jgi:hypothetical protein
MVMSDSIVKRKTIQVRVKITTGLSDYEASLAVETALQSTSLNNSEYGLVVEESKVIKSETYENKSDANGQSVSVGEV